MVQNSSVVEACFDCPTVVWDTVSPRRLCLRLQLFAWEKTCYVCLTGSALPEANRCVGLSARSVQQGRVYSCHYYLCENTVQRIGVGAALPQQRRHEEI